MQRKNVSFEQLADVMAFRVLVDDVGDCYHALGIIHSAYHGRSRALQGLHLDPEAE